jgi:hypothetical protein
MPVFNITVPVLTYAMLYRLEVSEAGKLISLQSHLHEPPEDALQFTVRYDLIEVERRCRMVEELLPLAIPLWCAIGFAPPAFNELAEWAADRECEPPNYLGSLHPEHLLRDYSFEYLYLALAATDAFGALQPPGVEELDGDLKFNDYDILIEDHPLFAELNQVLIRFVDDLDDRLRACNLLLNYPSPTKEAYVLNRYAELAKFTDLQLETGLQKIITVPEKIFRNTLQLFHSVESKLMLAKTSEKLNFRPVINGFAELPELPDHLWQMLEENSGTTFTVVGQLLDIGDPVSPLIDHCQNTGEWLQVLTVNFKEFQERITEDARIPTPEVYLSELSENEPATDIFSGVYHFVGKVLQDNNTEVDFKTMVNGYLSCGTPRLLVFGCFLLAELWEDYQPYRSRNATGEVEVRFPVYPHPDRLFNVNRDSIEILLNSLTDPAVDVGLDRGETTAFRALELVAFHQPKDRTFIIDYLLKYAVYTSEDRSIETAILLVNLSALGYRVDDLIDKISYLVSRIEMVGSFLMEAIANTYDTRLINLLKLWASTTTPLRNSHTLSMAIETRLKDFTDDYHGLPRLNSSTFQ